MSTTLYGYFRDAIRNSGHKTTYFNRAFLAEYIAAYKARAAHIEQGICTEYGTPDYEYNDVFNTDFYNKNGAAYCAFIEAWHGYRVGMDLLNAGKIAASEYKAVADRVAAALGDRREAMRQAGY